MQAKVITTGEWVELKRDRPHGKLTQDCIRGMVHKGTAAKGNEYIKSGRTTLAGSRSNLAKSGSSSKTKKFLAIQHGTDSKLDAVPLPVSATVGRGKGTGVYLSGPAATDASNGMGLSQRVKARG